MHVSSVRSKPSRDKLATKRRQRFIFGAFGVLVGITLVMGTIVWALFFSGWLDIKYIQVSGLNELHTRQANEAINQWRTKTWLGLPTGDNLLFVGAGALSQAMRKSVPYIKDISINKGFMHSINITASERSISGIWCFHDGECYYFDFDGSLLERAPLSSGYLLLTVNDLRPDARKIDADFLKAVQVIVAETGSRNILIKDITIPPESYVEIDVDTAGGYPIRLGTDTDISAQFHALDVFLRQRPANESYDYIDLRFTGRVYYKVRGS